MSNRAKFETEPYVGQTTNAGKYPPSGCYYQGVFYTWVNARLVAIPDLYTNSGVDIPLPAGFNPYTYTSFTDPYTFVSETVRVNCIDNYLILAYTEHDAGFPIKIVYYNLTTEEWSDIIDTGKRDYSRSVTLSAPGYVGYISTTVHDGKLIIGYCDSEYKYCTISYYPGEALEFTETGIGDMLRCFAMTYYNDVLYLFIYKLREGWHSSGTIYSYAIVNAVTGEVIDLEEPNDGLASNLYSVQDAPYRHEPYIAVYEDGIRFMYLYAYSPGNWISRSRRCKLIYGYFNGTTYTCKQLLDWGYTAPTYAGDPPYICTAGSNLLDDATTVPIGGLMPQFVSKRYMIGIYNIAMDADDYEDYIFGTSHYWRNKPTVFRYDFIDDWLYFYRLKNYAGASLKCRGSCVVTLDEDAEKVAFMYRNYYHYPVDSTALRNRTMVNIFHLDNVRVFYYGSLRRTIPYVKHNGEMKKVNAILRKYNGKWETFR